MSSHALFTALDFSELRSEVECRGAANQFLQTHEWSGATLNVHQVRSDLDFVRCGAITIGPARSQKQRSECERVRSSRWNVWRVAAADAAGGCGVAAFRRASRPPPHTTAAPSPFRACHPGLARTTCDTARLDPVILQAAYKQIYLPGERKLIFN